MSRSLETRSIALASILWAWTLVGCGPGTGGATAARADAGTWTLAAPMSQPRISHTATVLPSGLVLVVGGVPYLLQHKYGGGGFGGWPDPDGGVCAGRDGGYCWGAWDTAEIYDPSTGVWRGTGQMHSGRTRHAAFVISSGPHAGKVLVAGGCSGFAYTTDSDDYFHCYYPLRTTELFDPVSWTWELGPELPHAPGYWNVIQLADGRILAAGTLDGPDWPPGPESQLLDPAAMDVGWSLGAPMNKPRVHQSMVLLESGAVLAIGGFENWTKDNVSSAAEIYDPYDGDGGTWRMAATPPAKRFREVVVRLQNGEVLRSGACGSSLPRCDHSTFLPTPEAWIYDPAGNAWRHTGSMHYPHVYPSSVVLDSGEVLVAGGNWKDVANDETNYYPCPTPEVFDPVTETWSVTGFMPAYVMGGGAMVKLLSGEALFTGGYMNGDSQAAYYGSRAVQVFR